MRTAIVRAVIVAPVIVTTLPVRATPAGTVAEKAAPSTLYCQTLIVVPVEVPVTVDVAGFEAPPTAGTVSTCDVAVSEMIGAGVPWLPVSSAGLVVVTTPLARVTTVRTQMNEPGVRVGVVVDQPPVVGCGATVSEVLTAYSVA